MRPAPCWFRHARTAALATAVLVVSAPACSKGSDAGRLPWPGAAARPDAVPEMLNAEPPFRYPAALYAQRAQGNVTLRLFVDERGTIHPDSTTVHEPSGYPALDSAAMIGSRELRFAPAKDDGKAIAVRILFPVYFRHPQGLPLTGDTVLHGQTPAPAQPPRGDVPRSGAGPRP